MQMAWLFFLTPYVVSSACAVDDAAAAAAAAVFRVFFLSRLLFICV